MTIGAAMAGVSTALIVWGAVGGEFAQAVGSMGTMLLVGLGLFAAGAVRLPTWAQTRRRQMEGVAARLIASGGQQEAAEGSGGP